MTRKVYNFKGESMETPNYYLCDYGTSGGETYSVINKNSGMKEDGDKSIANAISKLVMHEVALTMALRSLQVMRDKGFVPGVDDWELDATTHTEVKLN